MPYLIYNLLLLLSLPAALLYFLWRVLISRKASESWRDNLGGLPRLADRPADRKLVWLHAVSVGEVVASRPLQRELNRLMPDAMILLTTITRTANAVARDSAEHLDAIAYLPLDYPMILNRAFDRVRPDVLVIVEAEIWPNLLNAARRRGIPTVLVNGRVSDRTLRRGRRWRWLTSWATSNIDYCCMQTDADAERIQLMGAKPEAVRVLGNLKFDQEGAQLADNTVRLLRADLGLPDGYPALVAGSTNPGEDEPVLEAFCKMRRAFPNVRLIIAPRQIERGVEIRSLAERDGFRCSLRSNKKSAGEEWDVLVLDTFGELASAYAVGDIAFVGGSLIPKGGHSLFQPILQGKPVLFGPYTFKTRDMAQMAVSAGVGFEIRTGEELAERATALLSDTAERAKIEAACRKLVADNRGASERSATLIYDLAAKAMEAA